MRHLAQGLLESKVVQQATIRTMRRGITSKAITSALNTVSVFRRALNNVSGLRRALISVFLLNMPDYKPPSYEEVMGERSQRFPSAISDALEPHQVPIRTTATAQSFQKQLVSSNTPTQNQERSVAPKSSAIYSQQQSPVTAGNSVQRKDPTSSATPLYLLLCVDRGRFETGLLHFDVQEIKSDQELFRAVRAQYQKTRGWFRSLLLRPRASHFVQVFTAP